MSEGGLQWVLISSQSLESSAPRETPLHFSGEASRAYWDLICLLFILFCFLYTGRKNWAGSLLWFVLVVKVAMTPLFWKGEYGGLGWVGGLTSESESESSDLLLSLPWLIPVFSLLDVFLLRVPPAPCSLTPWPPLISPNMALKM